MRTRIAVALTTGLLLSLTACSNQTDPKPPAPTPTAAAPTPSETPSSEPAPEPPRSLGSAYEWEATDGSVSGTSAVLGYSQGFKSAVSAAEETGTPGYIWAAAELKVCSTKGTFLSTTTPWTLSYDDGARIEPSSSTWDDFPKPEFPFETKLTSGKCVRGKLVYPVPGDSRPATVVYAPEGLDTPVEWTVPAK